MDAFTHQRAVLTPDLRAAELQDCWSVFANAALEAGARAVFAFPLQIGAISPGVLDLYADVPGTLDVEELADALAFADTATLVLLGTQIDATGAPPPRAPRTKTLRIWADTGPKSTRPPARSWSSSTSASRKPSSGCVLTRSPTSSVSPMSPPMWWPTGFTSLMTRTRAMTMADNLARSGEDAALHFPPCGGRTRVDRGCDR